MSVYEINSKVYGILQRDVSDVCDKIHILKQLSSINIQEHTKTGDIALYIKNLREDIAALEQDEELLKTKKALMERKISLLKCYVEASMIHNEFSKLETPKFTLHLTNSPYVKIIDEKEFCEFAKSTKKYLVYRNPEIDYNVLLDALKNGDEIPGAKLAYKRKLIIK